MNADLLRVTNLTLEERGDLMTFLATELTAEDRPDGFAIHDSGDMERLAGLPAFPGHEVVLAFAKGFATAIGTGFGKLLFDKLRAWAQSRNSDAILVEGGKATALTELPEKPAK